MAPTNHLPMRAVVKCKAKMQLLTDPIPGEVVESLDESLFNEVAATFFGSRQFQAIGLSVADKEAAGDRLALELASTYRQIKQQQQDPMVQQLNDLLED